MQRTPGGSTTAFSSFMPSSPRPSAGSGPQAVAGAQPELPPGPAGAGWGEAPWSIEGDQGQRPGAPWRGGAGVPVFVSTPPRGLPQPAVNTVSLGTRRTACLSRYGRCAAVSTETQLLWPSVVVPVLGGGGAPCAPGACSSSARARAVSKIRFIRTRVCTNIRTHWAPWFRLVSGSR